MIIVAGEMEMKPSIIADFEQAVAAMRPNVLVEDGCLFYSLLVQDAPRGIVHVMEMWESEDALVVHLQQPWILAFLARFGEHMRSSTVQVHDVAAVRPLPGM